MIGCLGRSLSPIDVAGGFSKGRPGRLEGTGPSGLLARVCGLAWVVMDDDEMEEEGLVDGPLATLARAVGVSV